MDTLANYQHPASIETRAAVAVSTFGAIDWQSPTMGLIHCPGEAYHTHRTGKRDCRITIDGAPTLYCFHTSCAGAVEEANRALRVAIAKAEAGERIEPYKPTAADLERERQKRKREALRTRAAQVATTILAQHQIGLQDFRRTSPHTLDNAPAEDWRLLLSLWPQDDVVWIGDVYASGKPEHAGNFRPVSEWLTFTAAPGNFTCGATFKNTAFSRSNENAIARRFLVIESDTLEREQMLGVIQWCKQFMRLRAVVDTGGKSLHGWFDYPPENVTDELRDILPALGCDPALFKTSQPCRLPGAWREEKGKWQKLLWIDLKGGGQ